MRIAICRTSRQVPHRVRPLHPPLLTRSHLERALRKLLAGEPTNRA
jgi:hypothetical protein